MTEKRNLRLLVFGIVTSKAGDEINKVAFSVWAATITGSASTIAIVYSIQTISRLIFNALVGGFVDSRNKRTILVNADLARCLLTVVNVAILAWVPLELKVAAFAGVALLLGLSEAVFSPAAQSIVPELFEGDGIRKYNSIRSAVNSSARIFGLVLASVIVATLGFLVSFVVNAATFLVSAIAESQLDHTALEATKSSKGVREYLANQVESFRQILTNRVMRPKVLVAAGTNFFLAPLTNIIVLFHLKSYGVDLSFGSAARGAMAGLSTSYSLYFLAVAGGGLLGARVARRQAANLSICIAGIGASLIPILLLQLWSMTSQSLVTAPLVVSSFTVSGALFGVSLTVFNVNFSTLAQQTIDKAIQGRFWAMNYALVSLTVPLGMLAFGLLQDSRAGAAASLPLTLIGLLLLSILFRRSERLTVAAG